MLLFLARFVRTGWSLLALMAAAAEAQVVTTPATIAPEKLVGIVIITHGQLGLQLRNAAEYVVGKQANLAVVSFNGSEDIDGRREDLLERVAAVDRGCGVLILTDMFGGTPSNLAISVLQPGKVEVVAGVNLPALIKSISTRGSCDLMLTARAGIDAGRKYLMLASDVLKKADPPKPQP